MTRTTDFIKVDREKFDNILERLRRLQETSKGEFGEGDLFSNSKVYEMIIANALSHNLVPGHSNTRDACDNLGNEFEYKHFKQSSSNHSWTFNDYSDSTIKKLAGVKSVIFAHIDDNKVIPVCDWYIEVDGPLCSAYLAKRTTDLLKRQPKGHANNRRMINFSAKQLEEDLDLNKIFPNNNGRYCDFIEDLFNTSKELEEITGVKNTLTSNKFWEVLIGVELGHMINSEQGGRAGAHDGIDINGNTYEYKVAKTYSWSFQDISDNVLSKYLDDAYIILGVVDKKKISVQEIYRTESFKTVTFLRRKLNEKAIRYTYNGKEIRRLQVSLSKGDLAKLFADKLY